MNKHCYRVIFSKTLNRLIVVSELSKAEGKHSGSSSKFANFIGNVIACIKPLCFSIFCALGFVSSSFADTLIIKADATAPKSTQPIVLQTANGIPQVNIQTPNSKGLSHNKYSKFDVDTKGAILNNSSKTAKTQLGGYVQGNPYLARGEAKVILNEVNSTDPSLMKGYVEVAGKKAEVIIANPSGISCQGCGVINSNRVTITTGQPKIADGKIESITVEKGTISVSGKGLDNSQVDYTEILSQKAKINAGIWSDKKLSVVTGQNTIKRSDADKNLQITHTKKQLSSSSPSQYAVDVSELGGMYSGKIHLVGTEQGLGVHNAGHIGAGVGEAIIDVNGKIINSGVINASQQIKVSTNFDIENTGKIEAKQSDIQIKTKGNLKQDGSVIAQKGNIKIKADKNITQQGETVAKKQIDYTAQNVNASTSSIIASGVEITQTEKGENRHLETQSEVGKNITVHTTESTTLQGKNIASGKLEVNATTVNLDNSQSSGYDVKVTALEGDITTNSAKITAKNRLDLTTPKTLFTQNSNLKAEKITTKQQNLNTRNTTWEQTGKADFNLTADSIKNSGGQISTQGNFDIKTKVLENTKGVLLSGQILDIKVSDKLTSTEGIISSKDNLTINSGELNNDKGLIQTGKNLEIDTNGKLFSNNETLENGIVAQGLINLKTAKIDNQQGRIASKDKQEITATDINNTQGKIQTETSLEVKATNITNNQGEINANQEAKLTLSNDLLQQKGVIKASELTVRANQIQSENSSQILANTLDILTEQNLSNKSSTILANKSITLSSLRLDNTKGVISSETQSININTHKEALNNMQGQIGAKTDLTVDSGVINNHQGTVYGKTVVIDTHHQDLINTQTKQTKAEKGKGITALETLTLKTKDIENTTGRIASGQNLYITAQNITNTQGEIETNSNFDLNAQNIGNNQGKVTAIKQLNIDLTGNLTQSQGVVSATKLALSLSALTSTNNSVITGNTTAITATKNINNSESEISATNNLTIDSQSLNNTKGILLSETANIKLDTHQRQLTNTEGKVIAGNQLDLKTGNIESIKGLIQSKNNLSLDTNETAIDNTQGKIITDGELALSTGEINNAQGVIQTSKTAKVDTHQQNINNTKGKVVSGANLSINAGEITNNSGAIAGENTTINTTDLVQDKGIIQATKNLIVISHKTITSNNQSNINGQKVVLTAQETLSNEESQIAAQNSIDITATGMDNEKGLIVSEGSAVINTHEQKLNNLQGKIGAKTDLTVTSGELDNTQGLLQSQDGLAVNTHQGNLINKNTQVTDPTKSKGIIAQGELIVTTQGLANQRGVIASGKTQQITAENIDNSKGIITGQQNQTLKIKDNINNQAGRISANGVQVSANTFDNSQQGKVLSTSHLALTIIENINNLIGAIKGNNDVTLTSKLINNQQGYIGSVNQNVNINTQGEFNNTKGGIEAKNNINLSAKGINNQLGIIYTQQGNIDLNAQSQVLNNQQGEVVAGKNLNLNSGNITNTQGKLFANNDNNITAINAVIDNQKDGKIQAVGRLSVKAKQLDNQAGFVQSGKDSTLTIQDSIANQKVADTGSLIEAGKTLTITTKNLNNQNTVSTVAELAQGIVAENLNLHTSILNNNKGGIYVQKQGTLTIAKRLNNQSGEILDWGNLAINGFKTDLTINNEKGKIQAQQDLDINAKSLSMNGHLEADNLKLKLKDDVVTEQDINAKTSLSIDTKGNIKNSKNLSANERLTLKATNIENTKEGKLSSAETRVTAKETITNRGLINSFAENNQSKTVIKAKAINNLGTGRIYGDYVALEVENILNQDEHVNGEDKSATIAARKRLDLAGKEIINDTTIYNPDKKGGSTLYSEGDIIFGRTLNSNDQAEGKAEHLYNKSSIIEANGSIGLNVKEVVNSNEHFEAMDKEFPEEGDHNQTEYLIINTTNNDLNSGKRVKMDRFYRDYIEDGAYDHAWRHYLDRRLALDELEIGYIPEVAAKKCEKGANICYHPYSNIYDKDYIIWDYFGIKKPDELPIVETLPLIRKMPKHPFLFLTLFNDSDSRREAYEKYYTEIQNYRNDVKLYNLAFKPYQEWIDRNKDKIDALNAKIKAHNSNYPSYYSKRWGLRVKEHKVFRTVVKNSLAGQILAGQNIEMNGNSLINDKSVIIAGKSLNSSSGLQLKNIDEKGFKTDKHIGIKHWYASYWDGKWYGGERKWENSQEGEFAYIDKESFDMNLFLTKEHTNPTTYKDYINVKQQNNIKKQQTNVELNHLSAFDITKVKEALGRNIESVYFDTKKHQKLTPEVSKIDTDNLTSAKQQQIEANNGLSELAIHKVALDNTQVAQNTDLEIRSIAVDIRLPNQGLYIINPKPDSHYVIETDPEFTNHQKWLSSDYMFNQLRYDHNKVLKRLGDGFYEQKLVREQINRLTGRQFLGEYSNFENQYKALMNHGVTFAKKFNLTPGISLSEGQIAQLTSDIVWFESQTITLPNGKVEKVLVPKVYVMVRKGDITGNGTLISGKQLNINADEILNQGTIAGRDFMQLNANRLKNSGKLTADRLGANIKGDIENIGGIMEADSALLLNVAGDLTHRSTTQTTNVDLYDFKRKQTTLDRKALLYVKGKNGKLQINANNVNITGADIINDGQGQSYISAKNNINLTAVEVGFDEKMGSGNHYRNEKVQDVEVSHIKTKGDVVLKAKNITSEGAELESQAKLMALAESDLVLNSATRTGDYDEYHYSSHSSTFSKKTKTTFDEKHKILKQGSKINAENIKLLSGNNIEAKGVEIVADKNIDIVAKNNINIEADTNYDKATHFEKKTKSGIFSGGGLGFTIGKRSETHHSEAEGWTQSDARSVVGSLSGDVNIKAGNEVKVLGSDLIANRENNNQVTIEAKKLKVEAGKDVFESTEKHEFKQSGLTIALSTPVTDMAFKAQESLKRSQQVKNEKLANLYKVKAANELFLASQSINEVKDTIDAISDSTKAMKEGDISNPSIKVSISVGAQKSTQESNTKQVIHSGSELSAGNLHLKTTEGDIDILGSTLSANQINLNSANNLNVESVQDIYTNRSTNKNAGGSIGVFLGMSGNSVGLGIEGSVQAGKGKENSDSITQKNSYINGQSVSIETIKDANFKGAVVNADKLEATIGNNLNIESRQDSNHYDSKQVQANAGFSVAIYGSGSNVSASASLNKAKLNYAQVEEQSGFNVGEGGMNVNVKNNTHLKGGLVQSKAEADKNHFSTNTLTTEDITNHSEVKVQSVSGGFSTGNMMQNVGNVIGATASALGNKNDSQETTTQSAIGNNINLTTKTGEIPTALSRDTENANQKVGSYDLEEIKEQQEAARVGGELAASLVGDLAKEMEWKDGSPQKIALHAVAGFLVAKASGGNGLVGAGSGAVSEWINTEVADYLKNNHTNLTEDDRKVIQQISALGLGAVVGAVGGASSESIKQGALTSFNAEKFNRQLHPNEMEWIKENAKRFAEQEGISLEEAESKLIERAVKSVDYLASKKIDSEKYQDKNIAADAFLLQAGKNYFKEFDKDSYYSPYVNATLLQEYDKAHDGYFSKRFQPLVKNSLYTKVVSDTLEGVGNYGKALVTNPSSTGEATSKAMRDGFYEYMNCLKEIDCIKGEFNTLGNSASDIINAKFPTDSHVALNSLYGKEVSHEVKDIAASRVLGVATEITPIIKGVKDLKKIEFPIIGNTLGYKTTSATINDVVIISKLKYPETANHIEEAISKGYPNILTIDRAGAKKRRKEALYNIPIKKGYDRDEYPPAMFKEGGKGSSIKYIAPKDNRGSGKCIGLQCKDLIEGDKVKIIVED